MLANDSVTVAIEIPIWLTEEDIAALEREHGIDLVPRTGGADRAITGHFDFLQVRNGAVHVLDYKPDARTNTPIAQLAIYALALTLPHLSVIVPPRLHPTLVRSRRAKMSKALYRQIIVDARDLIAAEHRWIQNARAITRGRDRIEPHHPRAKRFCAMGALERAAFSLTGDVARAELLARTASECLCPAAKNAVFELEHINDRQGHASVLKLFDDYLTSERSP